LTTQEHAASAATRMRQGLRARWARLDASDAVAAGLLAGLLALVFLTVDDYAISNDEGLQQRYGELIIAYYASGFADRALFHLDNLYLYGGLFDIVAIFLQRLLPFDPYEIRHVLSALIGVGGIAATWATARLVAGPRAGLAALAVLASCGVWYGGMFNHTKDIPFAAAMAGATYVLLRLTRDLPRPRPLHVVTFGLLLGAALGIRVLGLLLLGYAAAAILSALTRQRHVDPAQSIHFIVRSVLIVGIAVVVGYIVMIAAWPWAAQEPLNPIRGLLAFGDFKYRISTLLNGQIYLMANVPRWYVPTYLLIKLPMVLLVGALAGLLWMLPQPHAKPSAEATLRRHELTLIAFTAFFPLACEVLYRGPAFTGMRHFLFVVPPLAVLAGAGWSALISMLQQRKPVLAGAAVAMLAAGIGFDVTTLARLHPHQYMHFNALVGGLEGAAGRYATDYWVNILPEAVDDLEAFLSRTKAKPTPMARYTVAVCGERLPFEKEAGPQLQWANSWNDADFFIAPTHMNCDRALDGTVIVTIERLGVPIGVIKDRRALKNSGIAARK
jgi:hypothetical protein